MHHSVQPEIAHRRTFFNLLLFLTPELPAGTPPSSMAVPPPSKSAIAEIDWLRLGSGKVGWCHTTGGRRLQKVKGNEKWASCKLHQQKKQRPLNS